MQLPGAIRRGGRDGWISAAVLGAALAAVSLIVPWLLSDRDAFGFLAVWLGATGAGYLGHCLWDLVHHRRGIDTAMPWWWVPACLGYDAVVGAYILIRFL